MPGGEIAGPDLKDLLKDENKRVLFGDGDRNPEQPKRLSLDTFTAMLIDAINNTPGTSSDQIRAAMEVLRRADEQLKAEAPPVTDQPVPKSP